MSERQNRPAGDRTASNGISTCINYYSRRKFMIDTSRIYTRTLQGACVVSAILFEGDLSDMTVTVGSEFLVLMTK